MLNVAVDLPENDDPMEGGVVANELAVANEVVVEHELVEPAVPVKFIPEGRKSSTNH